MLSVSVFSTRDCSRAGRSHVLSDCYEALLVGMCPREGLVLIRHRRHQWCGPSPAEICHCSADTLLLAAKFLSPVALQCPWILNCGVLWVFSSHCSQMYIREPCRLQNAVSEVGLLSPAWCADEVGPGVVRSKL